MIQRPLMFNILKGTVSRDDFFVYFLGGLECIGHTSAYVAHVWFMNSNSECYRSKRARY